MSRVESISQPQTTDTLYSEDGHHEEPAETRVGVQPLALNVETALWVGVLVLGALLRLGALGRWPLAGHEALVALAVTGDAASVPQASSLDVGPLLFNLVALGQWLFGPSDVALRILPALLGLGLVALPWFARGLIGRGPALGAALMIAVSPALAFYSRQADDTITSAFAALWFVFAVAWYVERPSRTTAWHVALVLGIGLASGAGFWGVLVAGGIYLLYLFWQRRERQPAEEEEPDEAWDAIAEAWERVRADRLRLIGTILGVAFVVSTAAFTNPSGLGQALAQPVRWLGLVFGRGPELVLPFSLVTILYELTVLIWAAIGAAIWFDSRPHWTRFLLLWAGVTLVPATLLNSGWAGGVAHSVLPLALLAGVGLARVAGTFIRRFQLEIEGLYGGLAVLGLGFAWLTLLAYGLRGRPDSLWLSFGGIVLVGAVFVLMSVWVGLAPTLRTAGIILAFVLLFTSVRTAWQLTYHNAADPREPLVVNPTDPDIRYLADFMWPVSVNRAGHPNRLPIAVQTDLGPAPLWYLRDVHELTLTEGSYPDQPAGVLLSIAEPAPDGWNGQRVRLGSTWQWPGFDGPALVRWLVFRTGPGLVPKDAVLYFSVP